MATTGLPRPFSVQTTVTATNEVVRQNLVVAGNSIVVGNSTTRGNHITSGNKTVTGNLTVVGDIAGGTNGTEFTVARATGNTLVAGTLGVTGIATASGGLAYGVETLTAANAAASPSVPISLVNGTDTFAGTLPDGTVTGQQKQFIYINATADVTLAPDTRLGAYTKVKFGQAKGIGQCVTLVWTGAAWAIVSRASGAAAAVPGAVANYPEIVA